MFPTTALITRTAIERTAMVAATNATNKEGEGNILQKIPDEVIRNILLYTGPIEYNPYLSVVFRRIIRCDIESISSNIYSILQPIKISPAVATTTTTNTKSRNNNNQQRRRHTTNSTKSTKKKSKSYSIIQKRLKILNIIGRRCIVSNNVESLIMILFVHYNNYSYLPFRKFALWSELHRELQGFAASKERYPEETIRKSKVLLYTKAKVFLTELLTIKPNSKRCSYAYECGYTQFASWLHKHMGYNWDEWEFAVMLQKEMDL